MLATLPNLMIHVLTLEVKHTHTHTDYILPYQIQLEKKKGKEDTEEKQDKRKNKRDKFIESCKELGLEFELQDCAVSTPHA